jgi:hypothetical protein
LGAVRRMAMLWSRRKRYRAVQAMGGVPEFLLGQTYELTEAEAKPYLASGVLVAADDAAPSGPTPPVQARACVLCTAPTANDVVNLCHGHLSLLRSQR